MLLENVFDLTYKQRAKSLLINYWKTNVLNSKSNKYLRGRDNPILYTIFKEINMEREKGKNQERKRYRERKKRCLYAYGYVDRQTDRRI